MENLLLYLAHRFVRRRREPQFTRYLIGRTGCSSLLFTHTPTLHCKQTGDGERLYFYEHGVNGVTYGLITVHMKERHTFSQAENLLVLFLHRIQKPFRIAHNLKMEVERMPAAVELTDYWQDAKGTDWKIRGLCNGKVLSVLYVKNIGRSRVAEHDVYLNGFRFSSLP